MCAQNSSVLLTRFFIEHPHLMVLTGAGISTDSGIPDYRDKSGQWKGANPIQGPDFISMPEIRRRYWARSLIGWRRFRQAQPNSAHQALAEIEKRGYISHLVTQNVDRLHQRAGSRKVTDLHGRLDRVVCTECNEQMPRQQLQLQLEKLNPDFSRLEAITAPDGDAQLESPDDLEFRVVDCLVCGGVLKPDVVFFGENIPRGRVEKTLQALCNSDALLVVGSSLMVFSGYRYCREARKLNLPIAAINLGKTRADEIIDLKIDASCSETLPALLKKLP